MNPLDATTASVSSLVVVGVLASPSCSSISANFCVLFGRSVDSDSSRFRFFSSACPRRPLDPVSTFEARTCDPQGMPINVL
jgi:hypothetical protein